MFCARCPGEQCCSATGHFPPSCHHGTTRRFLLATTTSLRPHVDGTCSLTLHSFVFLRQYSFMAKHDQTFSFFKRSFRFSRTSNTIHIDKEGCLFGAERQRRPAVFLFLFLLLLIIITMMTIIIINVIYKAPFIMKYQKEEKRANQHEKGDHRSWAENKHQRSLLSFPL